MTAKSVVIPCIGISACTCENIEILVKSEIGAALLVIHEKFIK